MFIRSGSFILSNNLDNFPLHKIFIPVMIDQLTSTFDQIILHQKVAIITHIGFMYVLDSHLSILPLPFHKLPAPKINENT